jgi:glycosyltransferase involved in cell wall biosynthesis
LAANGWDVEVVAIRDEGRTVASYESRGDWAVRRVQAALPAGGLLKSGALRLPRLVGQILTYAVGSSRLCSAAIRHRPRVIHAHDLTTLPAALVGAKLSGARLVYDAHELRVHQEGVTYRPLWKLLERLLIGRADAVITTTQSRADWFARSYNVRPPMVLRNMVEYREQSPTTLLSDQLGLRRSVPIVLYQGGIQPGRGLRNLIVAARDIRRAVVVILGHGRMFRELQDFVRSSGMGEKVKLLGPLPHDLLMSYTASATIGVQLIQNTCLNHYTTDSNKLFEYIMAGTPVVASDLPEIRKVVDSYEVGLLVDPEDTGAIAESINRLLEDDALYHRFRKNTRKAARECNWAVQEPKLLRLYAELAPLSKRPDEPRMVKGSQTDS